MIAAQRKLKALLNEESSVKETLTTLTGKAELSDEERAQLGESEQRYTAMQVEIRAARTLVEAEGETRDAAPGAEERERVELRSRCRVGNILAATLAGRGTSGPELELQSELGFASSDIPTELWQRPERRDGTETRAISPTPSTVGVNMADVEPFVFAPSIASRMGIAFRRVPSGTYAVPTITTAPSTAAPKAKSGDRRCHGRRDDRDQRHTETGAGSPGIGRGGCCRLWKRDLRGEPSRGVERQAQ